MRTLKPVAFEIYYFSCPESLFNVGDAGYACCLPTAKCEAKCGASTCKCVNSFYKLFQILFKMSSQLRKLCSVLLLELFGETVQKVGDDIFKWKERPLHLITKATGLLQSEVRTALAILIQHRFVTYRPSPKDPNKALYTLSCDNVLLTIRYPKYLLLMKTLYGDETEMLVEEILKHGPDTASNLLIRAVIRFKETTKRDDVSITHFRDHFVTLVTNQFLMRCLSPGDEIVPVPVFSLDDNQLYVHPVLNMKALSEMEKGNNTEDPGDRNILWEMNFDRFNQEIRDQLMIQAIKRHIDDEAGELMKYFLEEMYSRTQPWENVSNPIPFSILKEKIKRQATLPKLITNPTHMKLVKFLDTYCSVLVEDSSNFISKYGDGGGGQYLVNIEQAITQLTWTTLENIVLERFGSKAARIFRIVRAKRKIDQDQIQPIAMIPAKEAKSLTYRLLGENFLQMEELRKSVTNNGPVKTFFLFHIDLNQLVRMVLEMSYKAVFNAMTRRESEVVENKRLIDKQNRIKTVAQNMREQGASEEQIEEIEEMITPIEVSVVEKVEKMIKGVTGAELQVDTTMFILQLFIFYQEGRNKK